jgi:hypothetical protein
VGGAPVVAETAACATAAPDRGGGRVHAGMVLADRRHAYAVHRGKQFPSWKALFGHMRCHPERQWRGITPLPQHARDEFTVQEREAASGLLKLAGGRKKAKKSLLDSPGRKGKESTPASSSTAPAAASKCDEDHKCGVCQKGFANGQALGGHKRCHWEGAGGEAVAAAATTSSNCSVLTTSQETTVATATALLDLNLTPPGDATAAEEQPRRQLGRHAGSEAWLLGSFRYVAGIRLTLHLLITN